MADITDQEIEAATKHGKTLRKIEPRASSARYDGKNGRIIIELKNGTAFLFPPNLVQGLEGATASQLAAVEILGDGFGLHWEELDVDFTVPGLIAGIFGTQSYMARRAGQAKSTAKAVASRTNGAKGGRPRKIANS